MNLQLLLNISFLYFFVLLTSFELMQAQVDISICETGKDINEFEDCLGKIVKSENYCCFMHFSYLGAHAKYCFEFPKKDIDKNNIKKTIKLLEQGQYWEGRIQSYDIYSIECDHSYRIKKSILLFLIYIFLY